MRVETFGDVGMELMYFAHGADVNLWGQRFDGGGLNRGHQKTCSCPNL